MVTMKFGRKPVVFSGIPTATKRASSKGERGCVEVALTIGGICGVSIAFGFGRDNALHVSGSSIVAVKDIEISPNVNVKVLTWLGVGAMIWRFSSRNPWRLCHCHCWSTMCGIGIGNKKTMLSMRKKGILPAITDWMCCGRAIFIENSKRAPEIMQSIHNGMAISLTRCGTFSLLYARQN